MKTRTGFALAILVFCSGCGTFMNHHFDRPPKVYGGIRLDCEFIGHGGVWGVLDIPFSLVGDTLYLPADLRSLRNPVEGWKDWYPNLEPAPAETPYPVGAGTVEEREKLVQKRKPLREPPDPAAALIVEDYKRFVQKLKLSEYDVSEVRYYEDETGQHAVKLALEVSYNKYRQYFLMYDRSNTRTKVVKGSAWHHLHF